MSQVAQAGPLRLASLRTRLLAMIYEAVVLAALLFVATAVFVAVFGDSRVQPLHSLLQGYLLLLAGAYFVWSWTGGRRTLAMRTWRLRICDATGAAPSARRAASRYVVAAIALPLGGAGILWSLLDRDRLFLHDRIAGTRLALDPSTPPLSSSRPG